VLAFRAAILSATGTLFLPGTVVAAVLVGAADGVEDGGT